MEIILVYMTAPDREEAVMIGRQLLELRLCACANILPGMRSLYRWEGELREADEAVLIVKTTRRRLAALEEAVIGMHSYACPCIVALPVEGGHNPFLRWIVDETSS